MAYNEEEEEENICPLKAIRDPTNFPGKKLLELCLTDITACTGS